LDLHLVCYQLPQYWLLANALILEHLKNKNKDKVNKDNLDSWFTRKKPSIAKSITITRLTIARSTIATSVILNLSLTKKLVKKQGA
jgi:hypothetical protein